MHVTRVIKCTLTVVVGQRLISIQRDATTYYIPYNLKAAAKESGVLG